MSDRIAIMNQGKVEQLGTPEELYERPTTRFVADFIGTTNLLARHRRRRRRACRLSTGRAGAPARVGDLAGRCGGRAQRPARVDLAGCRRHADGAIRGTRRAGRLSREHRLLPGPDQRRARRLGPGPEDRDPTPGRQRCRHHLARRGRARPRRPIGPSAGGDRMTHARRVDIDLERSSIRYMARATDHAPPAARADRAGRRRGGAGADHRRVHVAARPAPRRRRRLRGRARASAAASAAVATAIARAHAACRRPESRAVHLQLDRVHRRDDASRRSRRSTGSRSSSTSFLDDRRDLREARRTTAAGTTSLPDPVDIPAFVAKGAIRELDKSLIPNLVNLGTEWSDPELRPGQQPTRCRTCGGRPASATTPRRSRATPTSGKALWDQQYARHIGMLDDYQEVFAAGADPAGLRRQHDGPRPARRGARAARAAEAARARLHRRTTARDDVQQATTGSGTSGAPTSTPSRTTTRTSSYYIPEEGGVKGSDTMAIFSGRAAPGRRAPLHQPHARRAGQRRQHELHLLHGPERGGQGVHRPGDPGRPERQPGPGDVDKLQELRPRPELRDEYQKRWHQLGR